MQKEEYIFMWSSVSIMISYWGGAWAIKDRSEIYDGTEYLAHFDGEILTTYMPKSGLESLKLIAGKKYFSPEEFENYRTQYQKESQEWWNWIRGIEHKDYSQSNNTELLNDIKQFCEYNRDAMGYFGSTRPEYTFLIEQELEKILRQTFSDTWTEILGILTTSLEYDDIQKEYLDWLRLIEQSNHGHSDMLYHVSQYPWIVFGQFDDNAVLDYLHNRKEHETSTYKAESKELQNKRDTIKKKQDEIYTLLGNDAEKAKFYASFLQIQSVERMNIKSFWAGSYYLARNLFKKIAEVLGIDVWDMLKFIAPPEYEIFLMQSSEKNIEDLITDRSKKFAFHYVKGKEIELYDSVEAQKLYYQKIGDSQTDSVDTTLSGQVASSGIYTGKVRKVIAGDLDMLQQSILDFKEGEILVTSMTQPNMMIIAKKAGAIVTDEGGITSHAAIIARELGIPCVVGCLKAMQVLNDGDMVEVNGTTGIVKIVK